MNTTNSTINNQSTDTTLRSAENAVEVNLAKFETALAHLADRVEHTSHRVEHVGEMARKSRDELIHLKETARDAVDPFIPYLKQGKDISNKAIVQVKENPKPYLYAFAGMIGAYLAYRGFSNRRNRVRIKVQSPSAYDDTFATGPTI